MFELEPCLLEGAIITPDVCAIDVQVLQPYPHRARVNPIKTDRFPRKAGQWGLKPEDLLPPAQKSLDLRKIRFYLRCRVNSYGSLTSSHDLIIR